MQAYTEAAEVISRADALVITAGAGMGVDSGLPDFRGDKGFWNAYPMYEKLGINFIGAANPSHFERSPAFGWGFYGHRTNLYRKTEPHEGFFIIKNWIKQLNLESFIVTSNVDGQFQKAGFSADRVLEVHGSIHYLQCLTPCQYDIWDNREEFDVDFSSMCSNSIPQCPHCNGTARPNILMFGDYSWISNRTAKQEDAFDDFLSRQRGKKVVVVEMGAGTMVPTIRHLSESLGSQYGAKVIRINPREADIRGGHLSIPSGSLEALRGIDLLL